MRDPRGFRGRHTLASFVHPRLPGARVVGFPLGWILIMLAAVPALVVAHHAGAVFALLVFVLALGLLPLLVAGFAKLIAFAGRGRRERVVATALLRTTLLVLWFIVFVIVRTAARRGAWTDEATQCFAQVSACYADLVRAPLGRGTATDMIVPGTGFVQLDERLRVIELTHRLPDDDLGWAGWSEEKEHRRKQVHDRWLSRSLGKRRHFHWGTVVSDYDPKGGASYILLEYTG